MYVCMQVTTEYQYSSVFFILQHEHCQFLDNDGGAYREISEILSELSCQLSRYNSSSSHETCIHSHTQTTTITSTALLQLTTTTTTTTTIQRPFVRDNPGRPVPEETFTRSHPSWSTYFLYHLSQFAPVHGILFIQLTCLTVLLDNLFPGPLWSSPCS